MQTAERLRLIVEQLRSAETARRELFALALQPNVVIQKGRLQLEAEEYRRWTATFSPPIEEKTLFEKGLVTRGPSAWLVDGRLLGLHAMLRPFLGKLADSATRELERGRLQADIAALAWRQLRQRYPFSGDPATLAVLRSATTVLRQVADGAEGAATTLLTQTVRRKLLAAIQASIRDVADPGLNEQVLAAASDVSRHGELDAETAVSERYLEFFCDVCCSLEEHERPWSNAAERVDPEWKAARFLISRLYGMRTGVPGFDFLFQGGINLAEPHPSPFGSSRVLLIRGQFGAGKSLLALTLAAEMMRKGGEATYVSLDNSVEAIRSYLSSFQLVREPVVENGFRLPREPAVDNADNEAAPRYESASEWGGLKIQYAPETRRSLVQLLDKIREHLTRGGEGDDQNRGARLSLLVIDPVNAVLDGPQQETSVRDSFVATVSAIRNSGGNLLLVAETPEHDQGGCGPLSDWTAVLPYLADVVIDLSKERVNEYDQRHIEVSKSRFQRERRGRHALAIVPGDGIRIAPASAAFSSEYEGSRRTDSALAVPEYHRTSFGHPDIDRILGQCELKPADSIVLRGPAGCHKTMLGLHFLTAPSHGSAGETGTHQLPSPGARSLFFMESVSGAWRRFLDTYLPQLPPSARSAIRVRDFPVGFVPPGRLLQLIETELRLAREQGTVCDRVLLGNVGRWDALCPFVRQDAGFGKALLDLLRAEGVTALFTCAERHMEQGSALQRSLVDEASVLLDFERVEFGGAQRVLVRTVRSPSALRDADWNEVSLQDGRLQINPSLIRVQARGDGGPPEVTVVNATFHLFQIGERQKAYHEAIAERLRTVLNTRVRVDARSRDVLMDSARLGPVSVGSNLHVVQIDEFQLPGLENAPQGRSMLRSYPRHLWEGSAESRRQPGVLRHAPVGGTSSSYVAFPYYRNLALLTIDKRELPSNGAPSNWHNLAEWSKRWVGTDRLFFDFPKRSEDYNCLFLEIAASLESDADDVSRVRGERRSTAPSSVFSTAACNPDEARKRLLAWIDSGQFRKTLQIFHDLCAPAHQRCASQNGAATNGHAHAPEPWGSVYCRQWYTSLLHWFAVDPTKTKGLVICALPSRVAISGEWYLGVWAHSAVPLVGLQIIETLTAPEAQLERRAERIGLPVDPELCTPDEALFPNADVELRALDVRGLLDQAKRRSGIYRYAQISRTMADNLGRFLSTPALNESLIEKTVQSMLREVGAIVRY